MWRWLFGKNLAWASFWLLIRILLIASSTVWFSQILGGGSGVNFSLLSIVLLLGTYLLSPLPDTILFKHLEVAELEATRKYTEEFSEKHKNSPQYLLDKEFRKEQEPLIAGGSRKIFRDALIVSFDGAKSLVSVVSDAVLMAVFVDPRYIVGYGAAALSQIGTTIFFKKRNESLSKDSLDKDKALTDTTITGWENIVLGNEINFRAWNTRFNETFDRAKKSTIEYTNLARRSGAFSTILVSLPILGTTAILFNFYSDNPTKIALLLTVLPRQLLATQSFSLLSNCITRWVGIRKRLDELTIAIDKPSQHEDPQYKVSWNKISICNSTLKNQLNLQEKQLDGFLSYVADMNPARITIRADNGVGKSVVMCKLHSSLLQKKRKTYFLPVSDRLVFDFPTQGKSTGERTVLQLESLSKDKEIEYLLIDEWDANLDMKNISVISKLIENVAKEKRVVEIRHRYDPEEVDDEKQYNAAPILVTFNRRVQDATISFAEVPPTADHSVQHPNVDPDDSARLPLLKAEIHQTKAKAKA